MRFEVLRRLDGEKEPSLMHVAWAAQWMLYNAELRFNLSRPALSIPIFDNQVHTPV